MIPSAVSAVIVELGRAGVAGDDEGMIAGRREGTVDAAEHGAALVADLGHLAVHGDGRAHDVAAESLSDGLMAEADAEHRDALAGATGEVEADAGLAGRARTRRQDDGVRLEREDRVGGGLVVAHHLDRAHQGADQMDEVPGEGIVIVDDQDAGHGDSRRVRAGLTRDRPPGQGFRPSRVGGGLSKSDTVPLSCPLRQALMPTRSPGGTPPTSPAGEGEGGCANGVADAGGGLTGSARSAPA